ncbi:MAG: hypothetical protein D6730_16430 [Bacteroidetes bacterium]|nr:MAG: hypothetical protein D6730_16430 [Bacteroidota bacterium]
MYPFIFQRLHFKYWIISQIYKNRAFLEKHCADIPTITPMGLCQNQNFAIFVKKMKHPFLIFRPYQLLLLLAAWLLGGSCQPISQHEPAGVGFAPSFGQVVLPYDLTSPHKKMKLPGKLREVSGLSFLQEGRLVMVQDEKGSIFQLDYQSGEVVSEHRFAGRGDYEGIEMVHDTAYVLRSDGAIFEVYPFPADSPVVQVYKTPLSKQNDTEGLGYLPGSRQLLIACKADAEISQKGKKDIRAVYGFGLPSHQFTDTALLYLNLRHLQLAVSDNAYLRLSKELGKMLSPGGNLNFQPSAIAVHPLSGELYLLASVGKLLIVLSPQLQITGMYPLDEQVFKQPEGICFHPNGDLFISNEGKGGKGNVLWFPYQASVLEGAK